MSAPLAGKGFLADRLWEVEGGAPARLARQARSLGLDWVVARLAAGDVERTPEPARARLAESIRALTACGVEVWGFGATGREPSRAAALALRLSQELGLGGWAFEPVSGAPAAGLTDLLGALQEGSPSLGSALLLASAEAARRAAPALACAPAALGLLRMPSPGAVGLAAAGVEGLDGLRPVFRLRASSESAHEATAFLDCCRAAAFPGAAIDGWEAWIEAEPTGPLEPGLASWRWRPGTGPIRPARSRDQSIDAPPT